MSSTALGSGDIVADRYRIDGLLGQGGMGSVYRAEQLSMGRSVALKLLATEQPATREQVERFAREAQALARLQHPSTVRLFDFGSVEQGRPFIVMELLAGADLEQDLVHNGPMRWDQALRVCQQVLGSLGEAHALGIIHRDVKPANVYLCSAGPWPNVKLLDFGIAGCVELASTRKLTATGTVLGSAPYMSPEQAQGHAVGPAADLYALGVVLFEMLTGMTPFAGRGFTAQLVAKVLEPAPRLLDVCPRLALPPELCELVGQLLERDAGRRPASAQALGEQVSALLARHAGPVGELPERAPPPRQRAPLPPKTEPMPLPRTIADGWVPPSAPSAIAPPTVASTSSLRPIPRRRRSRRTVVLALSLALPALALAGWSRELYDPKGDAAPAGALLAAAPPTAPVLGGAFPVQVASAAAGSAFVEDPGDVLAAPDAGGADLGQRAAAMEAVELRPVSAVEPLAAVEPQRSVGGSRRPRPKSETTAAPGQAPRSVGSSAKPSGDPQRSRREPPASSPPVAVASRENGAAASGGEPARQPETAPKPSDSEPSLLDSAATSKASPGPDAPGAGVLPGSLPGGASPAAAAPEAGVPSAALPSGAETSPGWPVPRDAVPAAPPPPWVAAQPPYAPPPSYTPRPSHAPPPWSAPDLRHAPEPIRERSARWLVRRYPTVASASDAARAGEITPSERNLIVAELRRAREHERGRVIRQYREGYMGRGELRTRLREIDRRYEGTVEHSPPAGIHIWP